VPSVALCCAIRTQAIQADDTLSRYIWSPLICPHAILQLQQRRPLVHAATSPAAAAHLTGRGLLRQPAQAGLAPRPQVVMDARRQATPGCALVSDEPLSSAGLLDSWHICAAACSWTPTPNPRAPRRNKRPLLSLGAATRTLASPELLSITGGNGSGFVRRVGFIMARTWARSGQPPHPNGAV
jgi:hypothetical protein